MDTIDWSFHDSHRAAVRRLQTVVQSMPADGGMFRVTVVQRDAAFVTATFERERDADAFRATLAPELVRTLVAMSGQPAAGPVVWVPTWDAGVYRETMKALRAALGSLVRLSSEPVTVVAPSGARRMNSSSSREVPRGKRPAV